MARKFTALIDQSVKIEDEGDTVIAYSADEDGLSVKKAIILPQYVKRELLPMTESACNMRKDAYFRIFAGAIHLLLEKPIEHNTVKRAIIDEEYPGNESKIKQHLCNSLIHNKGFDQNKIPTISFDNVHNYHKSLEAHDYANKVRVGKKSPDVDHPLEVWKAIVLPGH